MSDAQTGATIPSEFFAADGTPESADQALLDLTAPQESGGPLLQVRELKTYFRLEAGLVRAVDGVSFDLDRGRTLGIVGESGSGKTVLARSVMGLLIARNVVREGSVIYDGKELLSRSPKQMRSIWGREMSMVFQDPMTSLNPVVKIGRQLTEGLTQNLGVGKTEAKALAIAGLKAVGIPSPEQRFGDYPHQLSGGMRQRVGIAIALIAGPKLLFADEPTTALDVTVQAQILDLLAEQQRERFMAMILVTHDLGVVANRADEIIVMYAGQIVEKASAVDLFSAVRMPYTEALLNSIPKLSDPSHTRLQAISGRPPDLINPPAGCRFSPRCPYVQDKCVEQAPPLVEDTPGHQYRCWFPVDVSVTSSAHHTGTNSSSDTPIAAATPAAGAPAGASAPAPRSGA